MADVLRNTTMVAAAVTMGLLAGLFYAFTVSVLPGLRHADDRTIVDAMQQINVAILNPLFFLTFFGAPLLTGVALVLSLQAADRSGVGWTIAALALYGVALVITIAVNVPLNNGLAAAGPPDRIADLAAVRARFEASWVRWNVARAIACTAAVACLSWALVLYGRTRAAA